MGAPTQEFTHTQDDELLDYFAESLPEQRQHLLEEHLAVCELCTTRAREVHAFHELWNRWTAATHGRAYQQELVTQALREAAASSTEWKERLQQWRTRWQGLAEAALQVVMKVKDDAGEIVGRGVDALKRPGSAWTLQPALQTAFVRGDFAESHDVAEFVTVSAAADHPTARVLIRAAERGEVTIRIDGLENDWDAPLALLVAVGASGERSPRVTRAVQATDEQHFIAHFADVPPGEYVILIEPLASRDR